MVNEKNEGLILALVVGLGLLWWLRSREQSFSAAVPVLPEVSELGLVESKVAALSEASVFQWVPEIEAKIEAIRNFPALTRYRA